MRRHMRGEHLREHAHPAAENHLRMQFADESHGIVRSLLAVSRSRRVQSDTVMRTRRER